MSDHTRPTVGWRNRARRHWRRRTLIAVRRAAMFAIGGALMLAGFLAVPTPVPGLGLALFAAGLYFLARSSKAARQAVKWSRRQVPPFSRGLERIRPNLPPPMRHFIKHSDPGR